MFQTPLNTQLINSKLEVLLSYVYGSPITLFIHAAEQSLAKYNSLAILQCIKLASFNRPLPKGLTLLNLHFKNIAFFNNIQNYYYIYPRWSTVLSLYH